MAHSGADLVGHRVSVWSGKSVSGSTSRLRDAGRSDPTPRHENDWRPHMAFMELTGHPNFPFHYNVDAGVGPNLGGHYGYSDVQLVQWMLKRIWLGRDK